jgi:muramoyltetrapeptide carboxypeptidase
MQRREFMNVLAISPILHNVKNKSFIIKKKLSLSPLKQGDVIGLIAPGSPIKDEKFPIALANMEKLGLKVKYTQNIFKKTGYLAGDDKSRLDDIHAMYSDKNVKAIWCLRGGYGCTRLLPKLDFDLIKKNPKMLIGYSDVTALLLAIYKETGLMGIHGAVAISDYFSNYTFEHTKSMLFGQNETYHYEAVHQENEKYKQQPYTIKSGTASGTIVAGNLSLFTAMIGSPHAPTYKNKIVFIEEVGEKPYRIDRMVTQMIQSTDITKCAAIVLGIFNECEPKPDDVSISLREMLTERFSEINKPCFYGFPFGHVGDITPLPIGGFAQIDSDKMTCNISRIFPK